MTMAAQHRSDDHVERSARAYRRLLVAYPSAFRDEYGDDLVQSFRDLLLFSADGRGVWWRTVRDLFTSAAKERNSAMWGGRGPFASVVFIVLAAAIAVGVFGTRFRALLLPVGLLIALPAFGVTRLRRAWVVRRTTGESVTGAVVVGVASFVPGALFLLAIGPDRAFWIAAATGLTLIVGSAVGVIWAITTLIASARNRVAEHSRKRAVLVLVAGVVALGMIAGGSYNSYRRSQGPPGDHSVANASAETRALWNAAGAGDVDEVVRLSQTCADPWVQFPTRNGKNNARGYADARLLDLPDEQEAPYAEIIDILADTQDTWYDRCGERSG